MMRARKIDRWHDPDADIIARIPSAAIQAALSWHPVQNILVHMPGGGIVMVTARYGCSPHTNRVARIREHHQHPANPQIRVEMTDIRAKIPCEERSACPLDWTGEMRRSDLRYPDETVYAGLFHLNIDYEMIRRAVALIRSVHGNHIPVQWNLRHGWFPPRDLAPFTDTEIRPREPMF